MSTSGLKATVDKALNAKPFLLVVDHLQGPSRVVAKIIKDLGYYGRTPIFLVARSPHMEDIGALQILCYDKRERLEMTNWPSEVALEFARRNAERVEPSGQQPGGRAAIHGAVKRRESRQHPGNAARWPGGPVSSRRSNQVSRSLSGLPNGAPLAAGSSEELLDSARIWGALSKARNSSSGKKS